MKQMALGIMMYMQDSDETFGQATTSAIPHLQPIPVRRTTVVGM